MAIDKKALIEALNDAVTAIDQSLDEWDQKRKLVYDRRVSAWREKSLPRVRALRDELTRQLKHGNVIAKATIRKAAGTLDLDELFYDPPGDHAVKRETGSPDLGSYEALIGAKAEYQGLVRLLGAVEGDTVSVNQIAGLGFRVKDLQQVFMAAVQKRDADA